MTDPEERKQEEENPEEREAEPPEGEDHEDAPESREGESSEEEDPESADDEQTDEGQAPTRPPEEVNDRTQVEGGKGQGRRSNVQRRPQDQRGETDPKQRSSTT